MIRHNDCPEKPPPHQSATTVGQVDADEPHPLVAAQRAQVGHSRERASAGDGQTHGYPEPIVTWRQLGVTDPKLADSRIRVYGRDDLGDPAADFKDLVMGRGPFKENFYFAMPDLEVATSAVAADPLGIAFSDPPNFERTDIKRIALAERKGMPYSAGKWDDIVNKRYPLVKYEYILVNRAPGKPLDPMVKEFVRLALSKEGQAILLKERFMPLNAEQVKAELAKLECN